MKADRGDGVARFHHRLACAPSRLSDITMAILVMVVIVLFHSTNHVYCAAMPFAPGGRLPGPMPVGTGVNPPSDSTRNPLMPPLPEFRT